MSDKTKKHWSEIQEAGAAFGLKFLLAVYKLFGKSIFIICLYPVILYFFATHSSARNASRQYLHKVYQAGSDHPRMRVEPGLLDSYRHFIQFGHSAIDRVASWSGKMSVEEVMFEQAGQFIQMVEQGRGGVVFGAHLGSIELCRGLVEPEIYSKINALMFTEHAEKFNSVMKNVNINVAEQVIMVNEMRPETAILLQEKIQQGEIIVILADRTAVNSNNRVNWVKFFGQKAAFGQGPFIMAALLGCPVYLMFCLKRCGQYQVFFEPFAQAIKLSRASRQAELQSYIEQYVERLEYFCKLEPYQWFNFYDYWAYDERPSSGT